MSAKTATATKTTKSTNNKSWGHICRVCSSSGDYAVFEKIPNYLHASSNEFLQWQKPINVLLEETTGLKVTPDDGLPSTICAICISYLKHASVFREQVINNAMSLKAVQLLSLRTPSATSKPDLPSTSAGCLTDKESLLIQEQDLNFSDHRQVDANLLVDKSQQETKKINKVFFKSSCPSNKTAVARQDNSHFENDMRYINLLFDKDINKGLKPGREQQNQRPRKSSNNIEEDEEEVVSVTPTSSEENEEGGAPAGGRVVKAKSHGATMTKKSNMFSYKEKNFEEDDIMAMENNLRESVTMNSHPEVCKERKCRACFRRFMFENSLKEHKKTCIEYKFHLLIEECQRLLEIRRAKCISPHEFIRRMIFALRKTCEWLKGNCTDILLPNLEMTNANGGERGKDRLETKSLNSGDSLLDIKVSGNTVAGCAGGNGEGSVASTIKTNDTHDILSSLLQPEDYKLPGGGSDVLCVNSQPLNQLSQGGKNTPINITNNILYEIERSTSRNSSTTANIANSGGIHPIGLCLPNIVDLASDSNSKTELHKPIAVHANEMPNNVELITTAVPPPQANLSEQNLNERLTFLVKLQKAAASPTFAASNNKVRTPQQTPIRVRKDLMPTNKVQSPAILTGSPTTVTQHQTPTLISRNATPLRFVARCNSCNLSFDALTQLELHNAQLHNNFAPGNDAMNNSRSLNLSKDDSIHEEEKRRIIALFEESEEEAD